MEVINRKTEEVLYNKGRTQQRLYVAVDEKKFYFTAGITRQCGLKVGLFVHFLNEGPEWRFFVNDDPDGFKLTPVNWKKGFNITNSGLCRMILKSTGYKDEKRFAVEKTDIMHDRCPVWKLSIEKVSGSVN